MGISKLENETREETLVSMFDKIKIAKTFNVDSDVVRSKGEPPHKNK